MLERLTQDEAADAIAVCTAAARGITNTLRFALDLKYRKAMADKKNLQNAMGDFPFTKNNLHIHLNIHNFIQVFIHIIHRIFLILSFFGSII